MEEQFLKVAKQAALEAGKVIQKYSGNFGEKTIKGGDKSNFATIDKCILEYYSRVK